MYHILQNKYNLLIKYSSLTLIHFEQAIKKISFLKLPTERKVNPIQIIYKIPICFI